MDGDIKHNADGWELVHDQRLRLAGPERPTTVTLDDPATVLPGARRSFFVWLPDNRVRYALGAAEGGLVARDDHLRLYAGVGITAKFNGDASAVQSPRVFRGVVRCVAEQTPVASTRSVTFARVGPSELGSAWLGLASLGLVCQTPRPVWPLDLVDLT